MSSVCTRPSASTLPCSPENEFIVASSEWLSAGGQRGDKPFPSRCPGGRVQLCRGRSVESNSVNTATRLDCSKILLYFFIVKCTG